MASGLLALTVLASGCQGLDSAKAPAGPGSSATAAATSAPTTSAPATPAELKFTPADLASGVLPDAPVTVSATTGSLTGVTLADDHGATVAGKLGANGVWTATARLTPDTAYTITAKASGPDGAASTVSSTFRTLKPVTRATYGLIPNGGTVGVGMPAIVQFDSPVTTKAQRAQVEKLVKVTTVPKQEGSWGWLDSRQLMWRPKTFWQPGTKVTVDTPLHGVQTGPGKWVYADDHTSFTVGAARVSYVDMLKHTMTVTENGKAVRTFKVSTGKPGPLTETRSGTKVIIERNSAITMDSATVGIPKGNPNYYKIDTKWNLRLTWTGEFIHSAPWSVGAQGSENVSHGCTNMAPSDAEWMFNFSRMGDVVKFSGSNRAFQPTEGIGVWVYSYAGWQAQSALR